MTIDFVEVAGEGDPVFLLHSSGLSGRQWRRLGVGLVERGFRVHVPDFSGHGASKPLPEGEPFDFRSDVEALVPLLRAGPPAHLVGHSYGGLVALLASLAAPESVRSLTLIEPVAFGVLDQRDEAAHADLARVEMEWGVSAADHDRWLAGFVDYWGGEGAWAALREEARNEFRRVGWAVHQGVCTLVRDRTPAAAYRTLHAPTHLITGERSPIAARTVIQRLAENIGGATIAVIPGAGHMAPLSHGELVNQEVYRALAKGSMTGP